MTTNLLPARLRLPAVRAICCASAMAPGIIPNGVHSMVTSSGGSHPSYREPGSADFRTPAGRISPALEKQWRVTTAFLDQRRVRQWRTMPEHVSLDTQATA